MCNIGDIFELTKDVLIYDKGLICQVTKIDKTNNYGITSYKRPCEIVNIPSKDYIHVKCLGGDGFPLRYIHTYLS